MKLLTKLNLLSLNFEIGDRHINLNIKMDPGLSQEAHSGAAQGCLKFSCFMHIYGI